MSDEAPTQPMLETILKEMRAGFNSINERFTAIETRMSSVEGRLHIIETQLFNMDIRFDRLESVAYGAHSQVVGLRADFKEFRSQLKEAA
jgi:hypothetical protein